MFCLLYEITWIYGLIFFFNLSLLLFLFVKIIFKLFFLFYFIFYFIFIYLLSKCAQMLYFAVNSGGKMTIYWHVLSNICGFFFHRLKCSFNTLYFSEYVNKYFCKMSFLRLDAFAPPSSSSGPAPPLPPSCQSYWWAVISHVSEVTDVLKAT